MGRHGDPTDAQSRGAAGPLRHEGILESQVFYLLGTKPVWDDRGKVVDVVVVPSAELGRPRVDIVIASAAEGMFHNVTLLMDRAVQKVKAIDEAENFVRRHYLQTKALLMEPLGLEGHHPRACRRPDVEGDVRRLRGGQAQARDEGLLREGVAVRVPGHGRADGRDRAKRLLGRRRRHEDEAADRIRRQRQQARPERRGVHEREPPAIEIRARTGQGGRHSGAGARVPSRVSSSAAAPSASRGLSPCSQSPRSSSS